MWCNILQSKEIFLAGGFSGSRNTDTDLRPMIEFLEFQRFLVDGAAMEGVFLRDNKCKIS